MVRRALNDKLVPDVINLILKELEEGFEKWKTKINELNIPIITFLTEYEPWIFLSSGDLGTSINYRNIDDIKRGDYTNIVNWRNKRRIKKVAKLPSNYY
jgi:hypothetical protein